MEFIRKDRLLKNIRETITESSSFTDWINIISNQKVINDNYNLDEFQLSNCPRCGKKAEHRVNTMGRWACGCFSCRYFNSNYDHQEAINGWETKLSIQKE